jgi:hypothetical protein
MKMKLFAMALLAVALCFLCGGSVMAQDQTLNRLAFSGAGYFDGAQAKGMAGFLKQLGKDSRVYSFSEVQFGLVPAGTGNLQIGNKDFQADFSTGILYDVFDYAGVSLFGLGDAGLQQTGESSSALLKAGGGLHKFIYKDKFGVALFGTWKYAQDRDSGSMQWKVNPAFALTFRF